MGTEVHLNDVNEDSISSSWPLFYAENTLINGQYYNNFISKTIADANLGCDKDELKQKMLEHDAIFKNQVYELHRLYRIQSDMMEEVKNDTSSSSSLLPSQKPYEDGQKWSKPYNNKKNNNSLKDSEITESRPSKVRKRFFDLELPPDDNIDYEHEEHEEIQCKQASEESSYKDNSSRQRCKGFSGLVDLNEPINVEDPMAHVSVGDHGSSGKPNGSPFLGSTRDSFEKSQIGAFNPLLLEGANGRCWLSNTHETGNSKSNMNFTPQTYPEISTRVQNNYRFTPLPFPSMGTSSSSAYMNSTDLGKSWGKSNGSLTHKLTSFHKQPAFSSSTRNHVVVEDKWRMNGCHTPNGFYHGSSSGSKDPCARLPHLPFGGFDHPNYNNLDDVSKKIFKGSNFIDLTDTTKSIDLNNDFNCSRKCDQTVFPWLQPKPNINKYDSRRDDRMEKCEFLVNNEKILGFPVFGNSCISRNESSSLVSTSDSLRCSHENGKIKTEENRGFDINIAWVDHENKQIDVEDRNPEKIPDSEIDKIKNNFDLNSCLTEDDDVLRSDSVKSSSEKVKKITMEIDLETPAEPEDPEEDDEIYKKIDHFDDEFLAKVAAEAIVMLTGMPSQQNQTQSASELALCSDDNDRLLWFVDMIANAGFVSNERDEYEELTLQQELTKEEDYMPKSMAPDIQEPDESRPRRGQARRGRPRRDFQRDILPGLVTLSRHEVTEDLQIFGGLMRATGHSWNAGPARRNGTRGRRKSVAVAIEPPPAAATPPPQLSLLSEVVGLEERSLTGWGKTTRRPRRPRCAIGVSVAVPLT